MKFNRLSVISVLLAFLLIVIGLVGAGIWNEIREKNDIEKMRIAEQSRSNDIREMELEQSRKVAEDDQARNQATIQMRDAELRRSFVDYCEKKEVEILAMINTRMRYLGCNESIDRCEDDYSYNLYLSWLNPSDGRTYIEKCIDGQVELLK